MPAIVAYLEGRMDSAMFPLGNLLDHGLGEDHPFAMTFWLEGEPLACLLGQTAHGVLLPVLDDPGAAVAADIRPPTGILGPTAQVRALESVFSLADAPRTLDHDEVHLSLALADLIVPDGPGVLRPMTEAPEEVLRGWMADYHRVALQTPEHLVHDNVDAWWARATREDTHRVLMDGTTPLAMTGVNARAPRMVQLGGVYTPPDLRGCGHARRAVALDLLAARERGVTGATLFASGAAAVRAYEAVGFRPVGSFTLLLFDGPQHV
ncbi:hypothetical protein Wenmar_00735 [Wenxinia marina DSM 24838]|uniref:N-acetyltransferase domain-containing protein n=1 Tax=Wenxinia marina DSM 24838 TaxID=1123501 RepID=A0A0D0Q7E2_9RHOB|nr:hypothetical protein Wenmar_00735 [Wenxinia marina DSM 24838]